MKDQDKIVGVDRERSLIKEIVGNLSAEVVGQTGQKPVQTCDRIKLLLPHEQKKSENSVYVTTAWANGVRLLVVVQTHVVENKITKASTRTKGWNDLIAYARLLEVG